VVYKTSVKEKNEPGANRLAPALYTKENFGKKSKSVLSD
jgi:hypothetical protein